MSRSVTVSPESASALSRRSRADVLVISQALPGASRAALTSRSRAQRVFREDVALGDPHGGHAGPARRDAAPGHRVLVRAGAGGHRHERDAALRSLEVAGGARLGAVLADSRVHQSGLVQDARRLPHALDPPVHGVVVGARDDVEAELREVAPDRGIRDQRYVGLAGVGVGRRAGEVDRDVLEVAEGGARLAHDPDDRREAGVVGQQLRERPLHDEIADRGERESVGDRGLELLLGRPPRVEEARRRRRRRGGLLATSAAPAITPNAARRAVS